jgi:pyruvate/2-oxoacid:ferredoxin oxidoreductase beta subunit
MTTEGNGDGLIKLTTKDFKSDQEVRWCPGCGDYAILAAAQAFMPELGIARERIVFVSGIPQSPPASPRRAPTCPSGS